MGGIQTLKELNFNFQTVKKYNMRYQLLLLVIVISLLR